ncbi:MAG: hypothetical protein R3264_14865 [Anaerolineae bacterium]|nr:hypothetical protein [Anaerolineae bacterium]
MKISISPTVSQAGTVITVTGDGAEPGQTIRVVLTARSDPPSDSIETVEFSPNTDGTFAVSLNIPAGTANGTYYVRAEQIGPRGTIQAYYYNKFQVGTPNDDAFLPNTGLESTSLALRLQVGFAILLLLILLASGLSTVGRTGPKRY